MSKKVNETLDFGSAARIVNLPAPVAGNEPARLSDLDAVASGLTWESPVRVLSTTNVTIASPGATIDGVTLTSGDRVLLTGQTTGSQNGPWIYHGAGTPMTRPTDTLVQGVVYPVDDPTGTNGGTIWMLTTAGPIVEDTTSLTFAQIGQLMAAGTGLTRSGNTMSLDVPVTVAHGGTGATSAAGARTNLGTVGKYAADFGDGSAASFNIDHNLGTTDVHVKVYKNSTGAEEDCAVVLTSSNRVTLSSEGWTASPPAAGAYRVVVIG